jgi:hypothetical protein
MEIEGKATGGRATVAHAGCFMFLCLCFVLWCKRSLSYSTNNAYFVESQYRIGQNGQPLRTSRQKCTTQHPTLTNKRLPQLSSFVYFGKFLTLDMAWCGPLEECATNELL